MPRSKPNSTPKSIGPRFNRIDYLIADFLAETEPDGESRLHQGLRKRYRPVEALEEVFIDCLALLSWRLHGCTILESGMLDSNSLAVDSLLLRDLQDPAVLAEMSGYKAMLTSHADNCRQQLDRFANFRKRAGAEAANRLRKLKPCTSVVQ
jgi:hypothetical protein